MQLNVLPWCRSALIWSGQCQTQRPFCCPATLLMSPDGCRGLGCGSVWGQNLFYSPLRRWKNHCHRAFQSLSHWRKQYFQQYFSCFPLTSMEGSGVGQMCFLYLSRLSIYLVMRQNISTSVTASRRGWGGGWENCISDISPDWWKQDSLKNKCPPGFSQANIFSTIVLSSPSLRYINSQLEKIRSKLRERKEYWLNIEY